MRNHTAHLGAAIVAVAVAACSPGGATRKNDQRGGARGTQERVALQGCVQAGQGNTYELHRIMELPPDQQPQGLGPASHQGLPQGSWVRLTSGSDLKSYLGQQVTIHGWIADTGQGTMGTSGKTDPGAKGESKTAEPAQPTVVAPVGALANGQAPAVAVEHVEPKGACPSAQ